MANGPASDKSAATHTMRIGIDFDNTLIGYDAVFLNAAVARRLLPDGFRGNKQAVRDAIRRLADGETHWQKLQGHVYGKGIGGAVMFDGAKRFLQAARAAGHAVYVVSHKTEFGHYDPERINLRDAARAWMQSQDMFGDAVGLPPGNVYFETTRKEKIERIAALGLTHFVDDLPEVLTDPEFPLGVERILFGTEAPPAMSGVIAACPDWHAVSKALLDDRR